MDRKKQWEKILKNCDDDTRDLITPLAEKAQILEKRLEDLEKIPFIITNPNNPLIQKKLPAADLYLKTIAAYTNVISKLKMILSRNTVEDDDPLDDLLNEYGYNE